MLAGVGCSPGRDAHCGSRATLPRAAVTSLAEDHAPWTNLFSMAVSGSVPANIRTRVFGGLKLLLQEQRVFLRSWMGLRAFSVREELVAAARPPEPARLAPSAFCWPSRGAHAPGEDAALPCPPRLLGGGRVLGSGRLPWGLRLATGWCCLWAGAAFFGAGVRARSTSRRVRER